MKTVDLLSGYKLLVGFLFVLLSTSLACNFTVDLTDKPTATPETIIVVATLAPTEVPPTIPPPADTPTIEIPPTATIEAPAQSKEIKPATLAPRPTNTDVPEGVTVTATTGNMFVRRGPGSTYSIVGGLNKGTTAKAVGRNEKNDWLAIEIPYANGKVGWISMGTIFTELNGSMQSLPLHPFDEAKSAYLQNCTLHDMTTSPGQWNLPAKTTQKVNPGEYRILDMYTGQNKVQEAILKEGNTISIKVDGDGVSYSCP